MSAAPATTPLPTNMTGSSNVSRDCHCFFIAEEPLPVYLPVSA